VPPSAPTIYLQNMASEREKHSRQFRTGAAAYTKDGERQPAEHTDHSHDWKLLICGGAEAAICLHERTCQRRGAPHRIHQNAQFRLRRRTRSVRRKGIWVPSLGVLMDPERTKPPGDLPCLEPVIRDFIQCSANLCWVTKRHCSFINHFTELSVKYCMMFVLCVRHFMPILYRSCIIY